MKRVSSILKTIIGKYLFCNHSKIFSFELSSEVSFDEQELNDFLFYKEWRIYIYDSDLEIRNKKELLSLIK